LDHEHQVLFERATHLRNVHVEESTVVRPARRDHDLVDRTLMVVRIVAAKPHALGAGPHGTRFTFPITGGDFGGPRLRGRVLGGGGDWGIVRSDGVLELSLRATLETDDGALIALTFDGVRHGPAEVIAALGRGETVDPAAYYFRTLPRFECADERYAFLNRIVAVGRGENSAAGAIHTFDEVL
jgi:Protein of unknown function (DUF3237)